MDANNVGKWVILEEGNRENKNFKDGEVEDCNHKWKEFLSSYGEPMKRCIKCQKMLGQVVHF